MKAVVVTGGTGFLGRNMIRCLTEHSYEVYAVVRPGSKNMEHLPKGPLVHTVVCELADLERHLAEFPAQCEAFYHFAWNGVNRQEIDDEAVHQKNIVSSLCCVRAAVALHCRCFVDAGSRMEYGRCEGMFREDAPCAPLVAYGRAKIEFSEQAKRLCAQSDTRFLHARIYSVYGKDDHPWSLIYTCVTKMLKNEPIELSQCTHHWNFMEVHDTTDLLLTLYEKLDDIPSDDSGIFNVANTDTRPLRSFVEQIKEITHSHSELQFGAFRQGAESAMSILPDMTKVERILGWHYTISFEEGIQKIVSEMGKTHE